VEVDGSLRSIGGEIGSFVVYPQHGLSPGVVLSRSRRPGIIIPVFQVGNSVKSRNFRFGLVWIVRFSCVGHNEFATRAGPSEIETESAHRTKGPQTALREAKDKKIKTIF
jgi:hypothetical protein